MLVCFNMMLVDEMGIGGKITPPPLTRNWLENDLNMFMKIHYFIFNICILLSVNMDFVERFM